MSQESTGENLFSELSQELEMVARQRTFSSEMMRKIVFLCRAQREVDSASSWMWKNEGEDSTSDSDVNKSTTSPAIPEPPAEPESQDLDEQVEMIGTVTNIKEEPLELYIVESDNEECDMVPYSSGITNGNAVKQETLFEPVEYERYPRIPEIGMIPSRVDWPGDYGFSLAFQEQAMTKSSVWGFSSKVDKLFLDACRLCPFKFKLSPIPPRGCYIRALPVFCNPQFAADVVTRCLNHSRPEDETNASTDVPSSHLIRCSSKRAVYQTCPKTNRQSVVVPYEPPQAGTEETIFMYEFMCLSSCPVALRKRPFDVIFFLERNSEVIGRKKISVKVSTCPGRDLRAAEHRALVAPRPSYNSPQVKRPAALPLELMVAAQSKKCCTTETPFCLPVENPDHYKLLKEYLQYLEFRDAHPEVFEQLTSNKRKKEENGEAPVNQSILVRTEPKTNKTPPRVTHLVVNRAQNR